MGYYQGITDVDGRPLEKVGGFPWHYVYVFNKVLFLRLLCYIP